MPTNHLQELKKLRQWVCWKEVKKKGDKKPSKVLINPHTGRAAKSNDSTTWGTIRQANALLKKQKNLKGLGFVFTKDDPFLGIDLDDCLDPETGELAPWANEIIDLLNSYAEISPSGTGVHIIVKAAFPGGPHSTPDGMPFSVEMYDDVRYFATTGNVLRDAPIREAQEAVNEIHRRWVEVKGRPLKETTQEEHKTASPAERSDYERAIQYMAKVQGATEGHRNSKLNELAYGILKKFRLTQSEHEWLLIGWAQKCLPSLMSDEPGQTKQTIESAWNGCNAKGEVGSEWTPSRSGSGGAPPPLGDKDAPPAGKPKKPKASQADRLVALIDPTGLFHSPRKDVYVNLQMDGHQETYPLADKHFKSYLSFLFYQKEDKIPNSQALHDALQVLEGIGRYREKEKMVYTRVGQDSDGTCYLDLVNEKWECVAVTPSGWEVKPIGEVPCQFVRHTEMRPLPTPQTPGFIETLRCFLNVDDDNWTLIVAWIVGALSPQGPYPILVLEGEQGSAKTMTGKLLRMLIDPAEALLPALPREQHDFMIAAERAWVIGYDNLSRIPEYWSDTFCRIATGGGIAVRELYSDRGLVTFSIMRPQVLTGIENLAARPDLQDRSLIVTLQQIPENKRLKEKVIYADFEKVRGEILAGFLDAWCAVLRGVDKVRMDRLPRMADFAGRVLAAENEGALPWQPGSFIDTYALNREEAIQINLEASLVCVAVQKFMEAQIVDEWTGTATELLERLKTIMGEGVEKKKQWPKDGAGLSGQLRRHAAVLRQAAGIEWERQRGKKARSIRLWRSSGE